MTTAILLVEDEENDAFFMQCALKKAGILNPVRVAADGRQAIDYFTNAVKFGSSPEFLLPCLVLLDLKLPYVMGLDVLKWIRQQPKLAPIVIILSASNDPTDIATAYQLGANAYLVKPSDLGDLNDMVKAFKDFWLTHNKPPAEPNLETVVAGLAERCHQQAIAAPNGHPREDIVNASEIKLSRFAPASIKRTQAEYEERLANSLKPSPQTKVSKSSLF